MTGRFIGDGRCGITVHASRDMLREARLAPRAPDGRDLAAAKRERRQARVQLARGSRASAQGEQAVPAGPQIAQRARLGAKELGRLGERVAASYLERRGYQILERNWVCREGEADIVAREPSQGTVVLAEVKSRQVRADDDEVLPELAVDDLKKARYSRIALNYLSLHPRETSVRFDIIAIRFKDDGRAQVHHLSGAYEWDD